MVLEPYAALTVRATVSAMYRQPAMSLCLQVCAAHALLLVLALLHCSRDWSPIVVKLNKMPVRRLLGCSTFVCNSCLGCHILAQCYLPPSANSLVGTQGPLNA